MSTTYVWADLQWTQQRTHLQDLLSEQPPKKDIIIQQLDKMLEGVTSHEKEERIRDLQGFARHFWPDETKRGWKVVEGHFAGAGTYSWENLEQGEKQERRRAGGRTASATSAVTLVGDDEEKGDNLGERKSPMTVEVCEVGENRGSDYTAIGGQGEHLSKEERKAENKAQMEAVDLELKRVVPVVSKYPKLLALITFLGFFFASALFIASAVLMLMAARRHTKDAPDEVKKEAQRLKSISDGLGLCGCAATCLHMALVRNGLLLPLLKSIAKTYVERYTLSSVELAALGCGDLEERAERSVAEYPEVDAEMRKGIWRRAMRTLVPFPALELSVVLGGPVIGAIIIFAS